MCPHEHTHSVILNIYKYICGFINVFGLTLADFVIKDLEEIETNEDILLKEVKYFPCESSLWYTRELSSCLENYHIDTDLC